MKEVGMVLTVALTFSKVDDSPLTEAEVAQLRRNVEYLPQHAVSIGAFTDDVSDVAVDCDHDVIVRAHRS